MEKILSTVYILVCDKWGDGGQIYSVHSSKESAEQELYNLCLPVDTTFEAYEKIQWDETTYQSYEDWSNMICFDSYSQNMFTIIPMDVR